MKRSECTLILAASLLMASCIDTPVNPAKGAGEQATRLYPDLGVMDSHFRRTFNEVYQYERTHNPNTLTKVDWPLVLARRTAGMLGVAAQTPATSLPVNPLDRGAYDRRRAFARSRIHNDRRNRYQDDYQYQERR